jgi:SMC interacting uncharacterized protein involved in chromosome segregation
MKNKNQAVEVDESILQIDELALDKECKFLPSQYMQAANLAVGYNRDVDELKAGLSVREAELSLDIRRAEPSKYGLEKVTESAIKEILVLDPKIQEIERKIRKTEHRREMAQKLVSALDVKKRSLTNLVELHSSGYHATVRPSDKGRDHLRKVSRNRISRPIKWERKQDSRED